MCVCGAHGIQDVWVAPCFRTLPKANRGMMATSPSIGIRYVVDVWMVRRFGGGVCKFVVLLVQFIVQDAFDRTEANKEDLHPSVEANRALEDQPIQLSTCLDVFNHSERLTDHYCSKCSRAANGEDILLRTMVRCQSFAVDVMVWLPNLCCACVLCQTKKMDLYRLPPLLVIQLKRFQFNQFSRRKLYNLVMFPVQVPLFAGRCCHGVSLLVCCTE
jgi:Ubiquitin carboxyl-terminal hydrolase